MDALADVSFEEDAFARTDADRILALRAGRVVEDAPAAGVDARAIEQIATGPGA